MSNKLPHVLKQQGHTGRSDIHRPKPGDHTDQGTAEKPLHDMDAYFERLHGILSPGWASRQNR